MEISEGLHIGDCLDVMTEFPSDSVDLIVTSPPYAERRKTQYGGIPPGEYVEWFLPRAEQMSRLLKPTGSFVLNIKEHCENGQRADYVMRLVLALRDEGWRLIDEYIWVKTTSVPGKWPNRFRDGWEHLYHFALQSCFKMRQDEMKVPIHESTIRNKRTVTNMQRRARRTGSGFGTRDANWIGKTHVYPNNVLNLSVQISGNKHHPAAFPDALPLFFVKLFTDPGDTVLDPFMGSGTTCIVAKRMGRIPIGIELQESYVRPWGQDTLL